MSIERVRGGVALVVALGIHLFATYFVRRSVPAPSPTTAPPKDDVVEIASELEPADPPTATPAHRVIAPGRIALATSVGERGRPSSSPRAEPAVVETTAEGAAPPADPAAGSEWTFRTTVPDIQPRGTDFAAWNGGRAAAERPDPAHPAPASTSGGVIEALDAADVERGLGRGGPVRTAVDLAARGDGPVRGNATFSVTLLSDGRIDVQVASAQTDWSRLIPAIREALRDAKIRMPPKGRGLKVVVAVDASVRYPDGYAPPDKTEVDAHAAIGGGASTDSIAMGAPVAGVTVRGRRCNANVAVTVGGLGAGAGCSAGVPARIVATRIVSEQRL